MRRFTIESVKKIQEASRKNKLVLFVGAGVSANSGLPSWGSLISYFAKGIGKEADKYTNDEYLKIPQYYFNERGKKEYYDIINKVFSVDIKPTTIHDILLSLNPAHIVTTNYDDLIELAAHSNGVFYDVVGQDKDLPYTPNGKMLIKMHGDMKFKNIVLKEDDYLSYSSNFRLIENFIKSLFATHIILFVGYSVNDPNVHLIFQWVKDILKEDFQHAYLLDVGNVEEKGNIDRIQFEYYKKKGINILYCSEVKDLVENLVVSDNLLDGLQPKGKFLYKFLNFVKKYQEPESKIETMYKKLEVFEPLNKVLPDDIIRILDISKTSDLDNDYIRTRSEDIIKFIEEVDCLNKKKDLLNDDKVLMGKIDIINKTFQKANIRGFEDFSGKTIYEFPSIEIKVDEVFEAIQNFNYVCLSNILDCELQKPLNKDIDYFRRAFLHYEFQDYFLAYNIFKDASAMFFDNRKYLLFFISEFNRKHIGRLITQGSFINPICDKNLTAEIQTIDLGEIYNGLPVEERKAISFIKEELLNFQFVYKYHNRVFLLQNEVSKEKDVIRVGGCSPIIKTEIQLNNFWEYITYNYLLIGHYSELKSFYHTIAETMLISYTTEEINPEDNILKIPIRRSKLRKIPYSLMFLMISNIEAKEISLLFDKYKINKLEMEKNDIDKCISAFKNLVDSIIKFKTIFPNNDMLDESLTGLSYVNIGIDNFRAIMTKINELQRLSSLTYNNYKNISNFIVIQHNTFKENIDSAIIYDFIQNYVTKIVDNRASAWDFEATNTMGVIENFVSVIISKEEDFSKDISRVINNLIWKINHDKNLADYRIRFFTRVIIPLFKIANGNIKEELIVLINNELKTNFNIELYVSACLEDIITPNQEFEECFINILASFIDKANGDSIPNPIDKYMVYLINLIYAEKVVEINKYDLFKGKSDLFDFIYDMNNFNFSKFDLKWLTQLPKAINNRIIEVDGAKELIKNRIRELIISGSAEMSLIKLYFEYYE